MLRLDDIDAVGERASREIGVEERRDASGPRNAEPDGDILRAVRHQQADAVTFVDPVCQCPPGVAVGACAEAGVSEGFGIGNERRPLAVTRGEILNDIGQNQRRFVGERNDATERAGEDRRVEGVTS